MYSAPPLLRNAWYNKRSAAPAVADARGPIPASVDPNETMRIVKKKFQCTPYSDAGV